MNLDDNTRRVAAEAGLPPDGAQALVEMIRNADDLARMALRVFEGDPTADSRTTIGPLFDYVQSMPPHEARSVAVSLALCVALLRREQDAA